MSVIAKVSRRLGPGARPRPEVSARVRVEGSDALAPRGEDGRTGETARAMLRIRSENAFWRGLALAVSLVCVAGVVSMGGPASAAARAYLARQPFACDGPKKTTMPCHFSTPSDNIRCVWTPKPNRVACVLRSSGRAYRLGPTGQARRVRLNLTQRGDTLPTNQSVGFPQALSCHDTKTTMTCNQNFLTGAFTLAPNGSHGS